MLIAARIARRRECLDHIVVSARPIYAEPCDTTRAIATMSARNMKNFGKDGAIVDVASIMGLRAAGQVSAYAASKAGVIHLTKALALEWARYGIRVNALCQGYIETDLNREFFSTPPGEALIKRIPQRRLGRSLTPLPVMGRKSSSRRR